MSMAEQLYTWLETGPTPACDHILSAALEHASRRTPPASTRFSQDAAIRCHGRRWRETTNESAPKYSSN